MSNIENVDNDEGLYPDGTPIFKVQIYQAGELRLEFEGDIFDSITRYRSGESRENIDIDKTIDILDNVVLYRVYEEISRLCSTGYISIIYTVRGNTLIEAHDITDVRYLLTSRTHTNINIRESILFTY